MRPIVAVLALDALPGPLRFLDARWKLGNPDAGRAMFEEGHIPSAVHVDMDRDLAGPPGAEGRHPLPPPRQLADAMSRRGVDDATTVIAYDDGDGSGAARLFWLLRHYGHEQVHVLDGGIRAWREAGRSVERGPGAPPPPTTFVPRARADDVLNTDELRRALLNGEVHLLDARSPERWRGDVEPIDRVAGRIPGAINAPASANLHEGRFRSAKELLEHYRGLGVLDGKPIVVSCGSGVTACVDLLGLEIAGVRAKLYPASYSGWLARDLPVERGPRR
jgi:thiosulfate/3-mercaptopyruvate sulfurtransferase